MVQDVGGLLSHAHRRPGQVPQLDSVPFVIFSYLLRSSCHVTTGFLYRSRLRRPWLINVHLGCKFCINNKISMVSPESFILALKNFTVKKAVFQISALMSRGWGRVEDTVFILQGLPRCSTPPILTHIFRIWHRFLCIWPGLTSHHRSKFFDLHFLTSKIEKLKINWI